MKRDLKRELPAYRAQRGTFSLIDMPVLSYLMIDGRGDPNTAPAYADALALLYPLAYKLKFLSKAELGLDYVVMPLEALWWADDMASFTSARDKSRWAWTLMIMVPDWTTPDHLDTTREAVARSTGVAHTEARLESYAEGPCVQTLHVGSYDDEGPVLEAMHRDFIPTHGLRLAGKHHEIYLSDPRRTPAERLKTILRQPVGPVTG